MMLEMTDEKEWASEEFADNSENHQASDLPQWLGC
jgi:hypothetical protein